MYKLIKTKVTKQNEISVNTTTIATNLTFIEAATIVNQHARVTKPQWLLEALPELFLIDTNLNRPCYQKVTDEVYDYLYRIEEI